MAEKSRAFRNSDSELRRLARIVASQPDDGAARTALMVSIIRTRGRGVLVPPPVPPNVEERAPRGRDFSGFCALCERAASAGISIANWACMEEAVGGVIPRAALELLVPPDGRHEMLRVYSSMPGMSGVQVMAMAIKVYPPRDGWTPRSASVAHFAPSYRAGRSMTARPNVDTSQGGYNEVTNFWMRRLAESGDLTRLIAEAQDAWSMFLSSAREVLGNEALESQVQSLALATAREAYGLQPPAVVARSESEIMSGDEQEALILRLVPALEAGVRLRVWAGDRVIHSMQGTWERGVIPDSLTAERFGAAGAVPMWWCMRGGDVVERPGGRRHVGGQAAVAFCRPEDVLGLERCGYAEGPAEDLLPDNIRWSTAVYHRSEYPLIRD